MGSTAR